MREVLTKLGLHSGSIPGIQRQFDVLTVETLAKRKSSRRPGPFSESAPENRRQGYGAMWGTLVAILSFIPYFGPVAGIIVLGTVGLLIFDTFWKGTLPSAWYLLLHLPEANFMTPVLLGRRFMLNPVVIFVLLIFWTWLWGVPDALLSVPILVSIKVVCDHVPTLSSVSELLTS